MKQMFGVGRSSIREAVKGLVLSGFLESAQGKGTFVRKDSSANELTLAELQSVLAAERIFELMELRGILECNAVKLAAERANSEDIQRIRGALERMKACKEDIKHFYDPDFDFHVAIAEASHNEMICEMMKLIVEKSHDYYEKFMPDRLCPPELAILTAEQIVDALKNGEGEKASNSMKEHLDLVEIELKRVVDVQR
jgi:GntR family transcriptional repressor for pyruvate dehydrogenase complex